MEEGGFGLPGRKGGGDGGKLVLEEGEGVVNPAVGEGEVGVAAVGYAENVNGDSKEDADF